MEHVYPCQNLAETRAQIDRIDRALVALIAERGICVRQAAAFKHGRGEVKGGKRVDQVMRRVERLAGELGADSALTAAVYRAKVTSSPTKWPPSAPERPKIEAAGGFAYNRLHPVTPSGRFPRPVPPEKTDEESRPAARPPVPARPGRGSG
ncbi:chorismate mutase [Chromobacterium violaceum]|uniref:chorismate mutase n=1 Tax=Chromobacterium violaceum TaxID=536 RepID=UPI001E2EB49E|nr:chorismate mutase [Chromobacterium violaceum]